MASGLSPLRLTATWRPWLLPPLPSKPTRPARTTVSRWPLTDRQLLSEVQPDLHSDTTFLYAPVRSNSLSGGPATVFIPM